MKLLALFASSMLPFFSALEGDNVETVTKWGLITAIVFWLMHAVDKRLFNIESALTKSLPKEIEAIKHSMNGVRRTMLIETLSRPTSNHRTRAVAMAELRRFDPEAAQEVDMSGNGE